MSTTADTDFVFVIERTVKAPRDRVWQAWTDPEQFRQWFGPKGCIMLYARCDLRPGGTSSYGMEFAGQRMFGQWAFTEVKVPEKLAAVVSFLDEQGRKVKHPMSPDWPMDVDSEVIFQDQGDWTRIVVTWRAAETSTDTERRTFAEGAASMEQGWGGTFEQLEAFLG